MTAIESADAAAEKIEITAELLTGYAKDTANLQPVLIEQTAWLIVEHVRELRKIIETVTEPTPTDTHKVVRKAVGK